MATKKQAEDIPDEEPAEEPAAIHPHGDEAMAELEREQEASRARNRELEAEDNRHRRGEDA